MIRHVVAGLVLTCAVTTAATTAAGAGSAAEAQLYEETVYRVDTSLDHSISQASRTLVDKRVVNQRGHVLSAEKYGTENSTEKPGRISAFEAMPFACSHDGHRAGFQPHAIKEVYQGGRDKNDFVQFQFFPYQQERARFDPVKKVTTQQWLFCATGGIDSNNGSRLVTSGPGVAYGDSKRTFKIGQLWKEGSTPGSYNLSLGFATEGPVKINGGVQQTPTSSLKGSPRPPFSHDLDVFSRNFSNGWWEASCAPDCVGTGGSTNFQGSVVEGLWEFPQQMSVMVSDFVMAGWKKTFCSNPGGCR